MKEILNAIILGIIQGLTEFLPVSSSGHLELAKYMLGEDAMPNESMLMTILLHGATALSTIVVFRKDIAHILRSLFQFKMDDDFYFTVKIILSMLPAVMVGLFFEEQMEQLFTERIVFIGCMLAITGLLLFLADRAKSTNKKVGFWDAIIVGVAQAIAIIPGISRSGATISASVLLGIDRERAARFSFLMVIPLILGKIAKDLMDGDIQAQAASFLPLAVGFAAAFLTGLFACTLMIQLVKRSRLTWFAIYCFIVAAIAIGFGQFSA